MTTTLKKGKVNVHIPNEYLDGTADDENLTLMLELLAQASHSQEIIDDGQLDLPLETTAVNVETAADKAGKPARLDRAVVQDILPAFMSRGIFSGKVIPERDTVLAEALAVKLRATLARTPDADPGKVALDKKEQRAALATAGVYKVNADVVRDYGDVAIGFSQSRYVEVHNDKLPVNQVQKLTLYRKAHEITMLLLAECYRQPNDNKSPVVTLDKSELLTALGYNTDDKEVYQDIKQILTTLQYMLFRVWRYNKDGGTTEKRIGWFISTLTDNYSSFEVRVNPDFLGCVAEYVGLAQQQTDQRLENKGWYWWDNTVMRITRGYSNAAYMLTQFLVSERGNSKIKSDGKGVKVVAFTGEKFIKAGSIQAPYVHRQTKELIQALEEIAIIDKIEPSFEDLKKMKPSKVRDCVIKIHLQGGIEKIGDMLAK